MFNHMFLVIEENKLKDRFGGTVTTAILEVLNREEDEGHLEALYRVLSRFNGAIKAVDEMIGLTPHDAEWSAYEDNSHDMYINILLNSLNKLYFRFGKINFIQEYSKVYWKHAQEFILQLWKELPEGKSVTTNEASFIKIFEDFFNETLKVFPDFIVKQLREFHNLYRASRYKVFDNYKYIMPDPAYCHDNRWNDDGVAFLYLSYDNEEMKYQNLSRAQKTCFEEIRAKDGDKVAFKNELDRIQKKLGLDKEISKKVQLQLSKILIGNICDSIFYAVDKEDDPALEAYIPFRAFSRYLIAHGFGGVAYRSTRMALTGLQGKCLTLFNVEDATYVEGEMEVYEYYKDSCKFIKKY